MKLKIKDQIPNTDIFHLIDGEPKQNKLSEILGNGKIILFGLIKLEILDILSMGKWQVWK